MRATHFGSILVGCSLSISAFAQECGSVSTPVDLASFLTNLKAGVYAPMPAPETPSHVAVTFHVVRMSNGTGGINQAQLVRAIDNANLHFAGAGIQFCWDSAIDYIDDDDLVDIESLGELNQLRSTNVVNGTVNVYTTRSITIGTIGYAGISSFTWSPIQGIAMAEDYMGQPNDAATFSHELGHYFDLWHTHEDHSGTLPECVACCNCNTAGDFICDTPADPQLNLAGMLSGCIYAGNVLDPCNSDPYQPDVANLMSYAPADCISYFSNQQNFRMRATLDRLRSDHLVACPGQNAWRLDGKFIASDGDAGDLLGGAVSISGDRVVVGAQRDDDKGLDAGSAYIFDKQGGVWTQSTKLLASDGASSDYFGCFVSISGNRALIGAFLDDDKGMNSGSAYIFDKMGGVWVQTTKLLASNGAGNDWFGYSVSLSGDLAIIGSPSHDYQGADSGAAYVFRLVGGVWIEIAKLTAADGAAGDLFGSSVSISGNRAIVGSPSDDDKGAESGSVYVFDEDTGLWAQTVKLTASDGAAGDQFGSSVSLSADRALVGAPQNDDWGSNSGSAYIFEYDSSLKIWMKQPKLVAPDGAANDKFGLSVSISGDKAAVGSHNDDDRGIDSGSAHIYEKTGSQWTHAAKLLAPDGATKDNLGVSVSISGNRAITGAQGDDVRGVDSGSAYTFEGLNLLRHCYPDCDQSTGFNVLDIFDFLCFQDSFVSGDPYACDCDLSTGPGVCDIFDFLCFQNAFVSGCP